MKFFLGIVAAATIMAIASWACMAASARKEKEYAELPRNEEWRFCNLGELKERVCKTLRDNFLGIFLYDDGVFYIVEVEGDELPTGFGQTEGAIQSINPYFYRDKSKVSAKTVNFLRRLYMIPANISLEDIYNFAEEFNTSIDYLIGRTDKEMM